MFYFVSLYINSTIPSPSFFDFLHNSSKRPKSTASLNPHLKCRWALISCALYRLCCCWLPFGGVPYSPYSAFSTRASSRWRWAGKSTTLTCDTTPALYIPYVGDGDDCEAPTWLTTRIMPPKCSLPLSLIYFKRFFSMNEFELWVQGQIIVVLEEVAYTRMGCSKMEYLLLWHKHRLETFFLSNIQLVDKNKWKYFTVLS